MSGDAGDEQPARWHTTNLVGVPAPQLAATGFNACPQPLHIAGAREASAGLFALLECCSDGAAARRTFADFMNLAFGLLEPADESALAPVPERRRWRASYLKLLQGWGLDANGAAGAVLKGWVESRFGLVPTFHKALLERFPSPAWTAYLQDKASARWSNNNIYQQLDLVYEFCQWSIARFGLRSADVRGRVPLWRGSADLQQQCVHGSLHARHCTVRLNNVVSFSRSPEHAGCFGDWVMRAEVPLAKLIFVPGLLDTHTLDGEGEVLAIGGDYEVQVSYVC